MISFLAGLKAIGGFLARHWELVAIAVLVIMWSLLIASVVNKRAEGRFALERQQWAEERIAAAQATAAAESEARRIEKGWRDWVAQREKDHAHDQRITQARIADLVASAAGLQQHIAAYTQPSVAAADSCPAARDLSERLKTAGLLLAEAHGMAKESGIDYDTIRDQLALCRGYVEGLTATH